jgi:hypothetical protein
MARKFYFAFLFSAVIMMTGLSSCENEIPVFERYFTEGPTENGNLKVWVRKGTDIGPYMGGATVNLYLSEADRTADNIYKVAGTTSNGSSPSDTYAMFYSLNFQKWYVKAVFVDEGETYVGSGDAWVPKGVTTGLNVICVN